MVKNSSSELIQIFGKRMMVGGLILLLIGILWKYGVDWPTILIVVGAVLLIKGFIIKTKNKLI